jgi:hypothetical protein
MRGPTVLSFSFLLVFLVFTLNGVLCFPESAPSVDAF